eukprot:1155008-Pelagomonas_calceolata.AAC.5
MSLRQACARPLPPHLHARRHVLDLGTGARGLLVERVRQGLEGLLERGFLLLAQRGPEPGRCRHLAARATPLDGLAGLIQLLGHLQGTVREGHVLEELSSRLMLAKALVRTSSYFNTHTRVTSEWHTRTAILCSSQHWRSGAGLWELTAARHGQTGPVMVLLSP